MVTLAPVSHGVACGGKPLPGRPLSLCSLPEGVTAYDAERQLSQTSRWGIGEREAVQWQRLRPVAIHLDATVGQRSTCAHRNITLATHPQICNRMAEPSPYVFARVCHMQTGPT